MIHDPSLSFRPLLTSVSETDLTRGCGWLSSTVEAESSQPIIPTTDLYPPLNALQAQHTLAHIIPQQRKATLCSLLSPAIYLFRWGGLAA